MAKSDGQVIIEARIDTEKAEKDLKNLENKVQKTAKNIEKTNVKVKVDSNTDKATKDLKSLESKAKDLSKNKAKVSVSADVEAADADLVRLKAQAKTLDKMKVEAAVKAETASAAANLARMQAQMRTINQMKAKATVTADSSQAEGKTSKLKSLIKTLVDKVHKVVIDADTTGAMASLAALNEKTKKATSGIKSMLVSLGVVNAISGAFNTLKSSISGAVSRFDTMKKYPKVMESLGVSSEMSSKSIQRLSEGIEGLPTTLDMVVSTAQRMTSMTGNIDKSTEATIALNNAFLASGSSTEDASRGMEQYLQMLSRGEVDLEGWRSLQETMPVALQKVAEAFGMTGEAAQRDLYDKLKSGEITFKDFQDKLIELGTGTGMLADLAKTNSEGVATSFKNLKTAVVKNWEMILAKIEEVSQKMTGKSIAENINGLKPLINDFFNGVASAIDKVVPYFQWFIDHGDAVIGVIGAIASAFAVLKVAGAIGSVFEAFHKAEKVLEKAGKSVTFLSKAFEVIGMGPIPIIIAAVAALAGALIVAYNTSETFRNAVNNLFSKIAESVGPIIEQAIGAFSGLSEVISNTLGIALANLAPVLARFADFFSQMVVAIAPLIAQLVGSLAPVIATIVTVLMNIVQSIMPALTAVLNVIMAVLEAVGPVVMNILSIVIDVISAAMQYISLIISFIGACINTIVAIISPIVAVIGGIMALIIDAIGKALSFITGVIATVVDLIVGTWTKVTNYIIDAINKVSGVISTISSVVGTVFNGIYTVCTSVMDKVDAVIRGVFDNIRSSWEGLTGFVDNIFHGVEGAVNDLVSQVKGFVNGVIGGINAAVGLINKIPGVTISEIPYLARGTDNFKGGFARINEGGRGELVMLPDGTQVIPHDVSMKYASEAAKASVGVDNQRVNPSVYLDVEKPKKEDNSFIKGIAEDIDAEWQKVSDSTTTKWQAIKTFLETTWASIKQNTINTAALMTHEIQGRFTTNYSTINNLTTSFASMMGQQWQRVLSQITAVLDRISSASSSKFNEVKNTAISIMNGLPSALYNVGVSAMNELISGINSRQGDANNAASSLVESLLNRFKEGLGIASPSREMFSIGQYMLQGLINGLDGDNLLKFVDNIVGTIKDNFSNINLKQLISAMGSDVTKLWQKLGINFGSGAFGEGGMMWPTDSQSITSYFGGRDSPGGIGSTNHMGIDIGASEGTPIYAAMPGTVTTAGWYGGYGNAVIIDHGGGMQTLYGHMSAVGTSPGMNVMPGQVIGFVGSTGNSTGPHLHFSVIQDGQWLDPLAFFPGFKVGSKYIPNDMLAYLHEGEAVVRKDENPHANSKGSFWTDILKGAVNSQNASIQNETSQFFYNTTNMITNNNNNETIQNVYFQETPKRPSEFRQALKQEGRRLAFGKQGL